MFCKNCNESISDSAKFCNKCGCAVHTEKSEAHTSDNEKVKPEKEAIDSHESDFSLPKKSSKVKKKKALIIAVSLVLVVALVVSGVIFIPQYIENKRKQEIFEIYAILNDMNEEYAAGNYEKAKELARKLPDSNKAESYIGVIEFREKMNDWSGTGESLLETFAAFCAEAENWSFYRENSGDVGHEIVGVDFSKINFQLIPGLTEEYEAYPRLSEIAEGFFDDYYKLYFDVYSLYEKGGFYYNEAVEINKNISNMFIKTLGDLDSLKAEYSFDGVEDIIEIVRMCQDNYLRTYQPLLFDVSYSNGYATIPKSKVDYFKKCVQIDRSSLYVEFAVDSVTKKILGLRCYGCYAENLSDDLHNKYTDLTTTSYRVVSFVIDLIGDVEIEIIEEPILISEIENKAFTKYFSEVDFPKKIH